AHTAPAWIFPNRRAALTDVIRTRAAASTLERPALLVLEALEHYLDGLGLGSGPADATPLPGGHSNATFAVQRDGLVVVLRRPLRAFSGSWEVNRTREVAAMTELERRLRERLPSSAETTLVHGDVRLGNALFAPRAPARVAALLDWEMSTLGDPLADLGYLCA